MSTSAGTRSSSNGAKAPRVTSTAPSQSSAPKATKAGSAARAPRGAKAQFNAAMVAYRAAQTPADREAAGRAAVRAGAELEARRLTLLIGQRTRANERYQSFRVASRAGLTPRQARSLDNKQANAQKRLNDLHQRIADAQDRQRYYRQLAAGRVPRLTHPLGNARLPQPKQPETPRGRTPRHGGGHGGGHGSRERGNGLLMELLEMTLHEMEHGMSAASHQQRIGR